MNIFNLIVFTQVNSRPTTYIVLQPCVPFIYWLKAYGYFSTFNIISFYWLTEYQQGATNASKITHEYHINNKIPLRILQTNAVKRYRTNIINVFQIVYRPLNWSPCCDALLKLHEERMSYQNCMDLKNLVQIHHPISLNWRTSISRKRYCF